MPPASTLWIWILISCSWLLLSTKAQNIRFTFSNSHITGGNRQPGLYTQPRCEGACIAFPGCSGVDYDVTDQSCWFHFGNSICGQLEPMGGTQHVRFINCLNPGALLPAIAGPAPFHGSHVIGGMFIPHVRTAPDCLTSCVTGCYAVDFDTSDSTCWQHNSMAVCSAILSPKHGSTHYRMSTCPANTIQSIPNSVIPTPHGISPVVNSLAPRMQPPGLDPSVTCGRPAASPIGGRIVGGDSAVPHSWPWQVALRNRKSKSVRCAGTVIAPFYILTTAHCVDEDANPSNWMVYSGAHDLLRFEPTRTMFTVSQVILHEHFDVNTFDNDIALLRLTRPITWTRHQSPVCLPPQNSEIPAGTRCTITGWGVSDGGRRPLKQASIPVIAPSTCRRPDWLGAEFTITDRMICAGYAYGGTDTCQGDSGGPMVCFLNNRWVQAGLTSFGRGCGLPQKPGVYTKVSRFIDWIQRWTSG